MSESIPKGIKNSDLFILLVDDEADILELISEALKSFGPQIVTAANGHEALALIKKHSSKLALIVSDYTMPEMTGFELRSKMLSCGYQLPFIILSANIDKEQALKALELKISCFLEKPFEFENLQQSVEKHSQAQIAAIREEEDLLLGFIDDASGLIEQLEPLVLEIENNPNDSELINRLFGLVHTMKGASGFFQPPTLHKFIHKFEDLISKVKNHSLNVSADVISVFLKGIATIEQLIGELKTGQHLLTDLDQLLSIFTIVSSAESARSEDSIKKLAAAVTAKAKSIESKKDLRVSVELLDEFMQISGEMTVIKNMLDKVVRSIDRTIPGNKDVTLLNDLIGETHKINCSIQSNIIEIRKVTVKSITKPFFRTVRDLSVKLDKEVDFSVDGEDIRIDAAVGEVLSNSLIHMIRNSLDHGIEAPNIREQKQKARRGQLAVNIRIQGDDIIIEVSDDGAGISIERIKQKLLNNGLNKNVVDGFSEHEVMMQLFEPGFSTATEVTDVSGRGVGMDMVKKSIESMKGEIEIKSKIDFGTSFFIKIPAPRSVLILSSLVVKSADERVCIPQDNIIRILEVTPDFCAKHIWQIAGANMLNFADRIVPLLDLRTILTNEQNDLNGNHNIVVINTSQDVLFALIVDEILDLEDTVVKPLPSILKSLKVFAGVTFMGDGLVGLILSPDGVAQYHNIHNETRVRAKKVKSTKAQASAQNEVIVFQVDGSKSLYCIEQKQVYRFESWNPKEFQICGEQMIVAYRGRVMDLFWLSRLMELDGESSSSVIENKLDFVEQTESSENKNVLGIIIEKSGKNYGFIVRSIIDIRNIETEIIPCSLNQSGIKGRIIMGDDIVSLVDIQQLLDQCA
jgi:two-component system chemotaxis sensor kinase CheA